MADTWNAGGTTFTAIKMNVTNTASAADSLLMNLQVGSVDKFKISKTLITGLQFLDINNASAIVNITSGIADGGWVSFGNSIQIGRGSTLSAQIDTGTYSLLNGARIRFASDTGGAVTSDLIPEASGILSLSLSTVAQTFRVYRTITDASNYERQALQSGAGYFEWAAETAGTGTDNIDLRLTPAGTGGVTLQTTTVRVNQTPTANTSAATAITNGADSSTNLGHRASFNMNGTTYWFPCGATAF